MKSLYKKIFLVQSEMESIEKSETNPYYKSKYFDVNAVVGALKPLLAKHNLVVLQPLSILDNNPAITTYIADPETGEHIEFQTLLIPNQDPQKFGACITYFRRYALTSFFLLQGEIDDDANSLKPTNKPLSLKELPF